MTFHTNRLRAGRDAETPIGLPWGLRTRPAKAAVSRHEAFVPSSLRRGPMSSKIGSRLTHLDAPVNYG
jgi:hypothetical protein